MNNPYEISSHFTATSSCRDSGEARQVTALSPGFLLRSRKRRWTAHFLREIPWTDKHKHCSSSPVLKSLCTGFRTVISACLWSIFAYILRIIIFMLHTWWDASLFFPQSFHPWLMAHAKLVAVYASFWNVIYRFIEYSLPAFPVAIEVKLFMFLNYKFCHQFPGTPFFYVFYDGNK